MAAGGSIDFIIAEFLLICLVLISLFFEVILHHIDACLRRRHPDLYPVLKIIYRELMVLGIISFLFIMYQTIFRPEPDVILSFEFAHVFIFLLAVFYTFFVLFSLYMSLRLSAHWRAMERIGVDHYVASKNRFTDLRLRMHARPHTAWRAFGWWFPSLPTLLNYRNLHEVMAYHDMRFQFIFYRKLPESFRFFSFLRKIKTYTFLKLVHTHWTLYIALLIAAGIDMIRRGLDGQVLQEVHRASDPAPDNDDDDDDDDDDDTKHHTTDIVESGAYLAGALVLILLMQLLAMKIRHVYWHLTKNPRMYFQSSDRIGSSPHATADSSACSPPLTAQNPQHASPILGGSMGLPNPADAAPILQPSLPDLTPPALAPKPRPSADRKDTAVFHENLTDSVADLFDALQSDDPAPPQQEKLQAQRDDRIESVTDTGSADSRSADMPNAFVKHKSLAITNATLAENLEHRKHAEKAQVRQYPWLVRKLLPRITRVASPVEKLFWFGSHHFYFWCVQFVIFFTTVLLSAVTSAVILAKVEGRPVTTLNIIALLLAVVALFFVLMRTAVIIKRYTFVLLNASLIPESMTAKSIRSAERKRLLRARGILDRRPDESLDSDSSSETEAEMETEAAGPTRAQTTGRTGAAGEDVQDMRGLQRRPTVVGFMRSEAAKGNTAVLSTDDMHVV